MRPHHLAVAAAVAVVLWAIGLAHAAWLPFAAVALHSGTGPASCRRPWRAGAGR